MKRKPLLLAAALACVVGAALWGANWRLDHPPLLSEDKRFRAAVAGADSVETTQAVCADAACSRTRIVSTRLGAAQTRELIRHLRFVPFDGVARIGGKPPYYETGLKFMGGRRKLLEMSLAQSGGHSYLYAARPARNYKLSARFEKSLQSYLSRTLPPPANLIH